MILAAVDGMERDNRRNYRSIRSDDMWLILWRYSSFSLDADTHLLYRLGVYGGSFYATPQNHIEAIIYSLKDV